MSGVVDCEFCGGVNLITRETCMYCGSILPAPEPPHEFDRPKFDVGMEWAAPGDNQEDVWKLFFHDRDCGEQLFRGPDAEKEAWAAWDRFAPSYNVNLFRQVRMKERPVTEIAAVDPSREKIRRVMKLINEMRSPGAKLTPMDEWADMLQDILESLP